MSKGIIEIVRDVVESASRNVTIRLDGGGGDVLEMESPHINYLFGNAQYMKDMLDVKSVGAAGFWNPQEPKFPLVHLFTPIVEKHDGADYELRATVSLLIATSSRQDWSNERRMMSSFKMVLEPIYEAFMDALRHDTRVMEPYKGFFPHEKEDNYSYGRYGAYTESGEKVSEPIDAIVIRGLELKIAKENCRNYKR